MALVTIKVRDKGVGTDKATIDFNTKSSPPFKAGELTPAQVLALTMLAVSRAAAENRPFFMDSKGRVIEVEEKEDKDGKVTYGEKTTGVAPEKEVANAG
jgi:hypothetical protein